LPFQDSSLLAQGEHFWLERRWAEEGLPDDGEDDFDNLMHAGEGIRWWRKIPRLLPQME